MGFRAARASRSFVASILAGIGLAACHSPTPTAPTAPTPALLDIAPPAATAPESSASVTADTAKIGAGTVIRINQGTLALQTLQPGTVTLRGTHGFRFDGRVQSGLEPSNYCSPFDPCQPGATLPFTATWVGTDIPGTVRLQGQEFPVGSLVTGSIYIELTGAFTAPPHLTPTATVTVPFTATGLLTRDYPDPQLQMTGGGKVTFTLEWQSAIGGWAIRFSSFDFNPS